MNYKFKGLIRWSRVNISDINIHNIESIKQRERLFCLFDKDKPYSLDVVHMTDYAPINNFTIGGLYITNRVPFYRYAGITTFRYQTKEECDEEINIVNRLKNLINHEKVPEHLKATK
jgi:hypothetical protein